MTPRRVRVGLFTFLGLSIGLSANMLLLQPKSGRQASGRAVQETTLWQGLEQAPSVAGAVPSGDAPPSALTTGTLSAADMVLSPSAEQTRETKVPGDVIRGVQRELKTRGYEPGAADGVPGIVTRAAVMAYEFDHGLPLTGDPSEQLLKQIVLGSAASDAPAGGVASPTDRHAETVIRTVQKSLKALGYAPGEADGALSEATVRAIGEFEADQKLAATGRISSPLVQRLMRLSAQARVAQQP